MRALSSLGPHARVRTTRFGATLMALALLASGAASAEARSNAKLATTGADPIVSTSAGLVRGTVVSDTYAFRGVPYAAAPTGNLRWRPPAPTAAWMGVRDATQYGANCAQPDAPPFSAQSLAEDCLFLNVQTPSLSAGTRLPVFVWIHGGGWTGGAGRDYDGTLLSKEGVVVVAENQDGAKRRSVYLQQRRTQVLPLPFVAHLQGAHVRRVQDLPTPG